MIALLISVLGQWATAPQASLRGFLRKRPQFQTLLIVVAFHFALTQASQMAALRFSAIADMPEAQPFLQDVPPFAQAMMLFATLAGWAAMAQVLWVAGRSLNGRGGIEDARAAAAWWMFGAGFMHPVGALLIIIAPVPLLLFVFALLALGLQLRVLSRFAAELHGVPPGGATLAVGFASLVAMMLAGQIALLLLVAPFLSSAGG